MNILFQKRQSRCSRCLRALINIVLGLRPGVFVWDLGERKLFLSNANYFSITTPSPVRTPHIHIASPAATRARNTRKGQSCCDCVCTINVWEIAFFLHQNVLVNLTNTVAWYHSDISDRISNESMYAMVLTPVQNIHMIWNQMKESNLFNQPFSLYRRSAEFPSVPFGTELSIGWHYLNKKY